MPDRGRISDKIIETSPDSYLRLLGVGENSAKLMNFVRAFIGGHAELPRQLEQVATSRLRRMDYQLSLLHGRSNCYPVGSLIRVIIQVDYLLWLRVSSRATIDRLNCLSRSCVTVPLTSRPLLVLNSAMELHTAMEREFHLFTIFNATHSILLQNACNLRRDRRACYSSL
jgi:hypothetical protein